MKNKKRTHVTVKEAASALGVSPSTVYKWVNEGTLKAKRLGPLMIRINVSELKRMHRDG